MGWTIVQVILPRAVATDKISASCKGQPVVKSEKNKVLMNYCFSNITTKQQFLFFEAL